VHALIGPTTRPWRSATGARASLVAATVRSTAPVRRHPSLMSSLNQPEAGGDTGGDLCAVRTFFTGIKHAGMDNRLRLRAKRDPAALADLAKRRLRAKIPAFTEALSGRFTEHHAFLARVHLDLIDQHSAAIDDITRRIEETIAPFHAFRTMICTIPGISTLTANVIIAETGADMTRFPTAAQLASWAGTTPGNNESAGKVKSGRTRPGNPYLQGALG
jgi:transposase